MFFRVPPKTETVILLVSLKKPPTKGIPRKDTAHVARQPITIPSKVRKSTLGMDPLGISPPVSVHIIFAFPLGISSELVGASGPKRHIITATREPGLNTDDQLISLMIGVA